MKTKRLARHFPNVTLRTQDDQPVRFYDDVVKGKKVVVINFMFTTCTSLCPRETANLANFHHALANIAIGGETLGWWYHGPRLAVQPLIIWWALWASGAVDWPFGKRKIQSSLRA